ncbi:hypothetical protein AUEXF2481DRAFT_180030 [Aureobasidium subglaciale EXF-2481]|uniref:Uncharacterized protein n=1 Tax=Aureobasidium subglaciale (strain EXF-2481) TaxID=1043005 RepID=A0A074YTL4_AURSE|nr:uncharacterized protein AUEXF2481DRAFT_180030 [Aureobasidium subglaciale EXF-2481]KEQ99494.1 hypothetical protein AUEXF2481DRAFT_180030 [Aureobasidium subglaciale EXF-2481]
MGRCGFESCSLRWFPFCYLMKVGGTFCLSRGMLRAGVKSRQMKRVDDHVLKYGRWRCSRWYYVLWTSLITLSYR